MIQDSAKIALIIGATGSFGGHATKALMNHGWTIRALARDPVAAAAKLSPHIPVDWMKGDAMDRASVVAAARGVQLIVHAANPPGYRNWKGTVVPMIDNAIAAARASGARLVIPGSVYNFAPDSGPSIGEDAQQAPATRKGAIRVEVEQRLRRASAESVKVLILRAGDFFGPAAPASALTFLARKRRGHLSGIYSPGPAAHAFAYLPDLCETLARLIDAEDRLGVFEVFHFRGHWVANNHTLGESIRRVTGDPTLPIEGFPWIIVRLTAPFNETFREMLEMRYLWDKPIGLDNAKLVRFLGEEPHTPIDVALKATLADMGLVSTVRQAIAVRRRKSESRARHRQRDVAGAVVTPSCRLTAPASLSTEGSPDRPPRSIPPPRSRNLVIAGAARRRCRHSRAVTWASPGSSRRLVSCGP